MDAQRMLMIENVLFTAAMVLYFAAMILYFIFFVMKSGKLSGIGGIVLSIAFALHTLALAARWIGAGRVPLTNQYEFATSFAWGIALVSLVFIWKYSFQALGTFVTPVIFVIIGYAAMQSREVRELMPALRSNWLVFHVSAAIISYGAFGVSFAVSLLFLLRGRLEGRGHTGADQDAGHKSFIARYIPDARHLDMISYRAVALGLLFLTFVIVTGAIWAERAWGSYWSWDPKETWSLVTWIIYALYLHLRIARGWKGKSAAIFAVIGFLCVIFTYIGVNTFLPGVHSYA